MIELTLGSLISPDKCLGFFISKIKKFKKKIIDKSMLG